MKKQGEEMAAVVSASPGSERESVLASQLTEAVAKSNELEKAVSELEAAVRSAQKQRGEAEAEAERNAASREAAEKEALSLRGELSASHDEVRRLEEAVAKAGSEVKAVLSVSGSDREKVLGDQLASAKGRVAEVEKLLATSEHALQSAQKQRGEAHV